MKRMWLALGLGCLVCCLPLIVPFMGAAGLAGGVGWTAGLRWTEIACVAVLAALGAIAMLLVIRWRRRAGVDRCERRT